MGFLNNLNIGKRLNLVFGIILLLTLGNLVYNLANLETSKESVVSINSSLISIDQLIEADRDAYQSSIAINAALLMDSASYDAEKMKKIIGYISENRDQVKDRYDSFSKIFDVKANEEFKKYDENFRNNYRSLSVCTDTIISCLQERNFAKARYLYFEVYGTYFKPMRETLNSFTELHLKGSADSYASNLEMNYNIKRNSIVMFVLIFSIFIVSGWVLTRSITRPLANLKNIIAELSIGKLPEVKLDGNDEIAVMGSYVVKLTDSLKGTAGFAQEIGNGNLKADFNPASDEDVLGHSLVAMKANLAKFAEEDDQRNWLNNGVASMADILRNNNLSNEELYANTLSYVIHYLEANQGGLFIINDDDEQNPYIELVSSYAYERKKFLTKRLEIGEGLVGQAVLEKDSIYMTNIPQDYVKITSGIGEATPRNILIVPLLNNEMVLGVIELASFRVLKDHEIEFVKRISSSIAGTISTVKINDKTKRLLETSQQMTEELRAQEEEMRQNMEELSATQEDAHKNVEEMSRVRKELQVREGVFGITTILSEADVYGNIVMVNQ